MNRKVFFDSIRKSLGSLKQGHVEGIGRILDYWATTWPNMPVEELAYVLATVKWETGHTFQPIREKGGASARYAPYYGRGLVQITWRANYEKYGIADDPDKALEWPTALRILFDGMIFGRFTGKKLADYISPDHRDYVGARAIVNGADRADTIASYAAKFLDAMRAAMAAEPEVEKPKASIGAKVGGTIVATGATAAGANVAMGGDEMTSLIVASGSALAGLASWLAPKIKNMMATKPVETPTPKPPPPEETDLVLQPTDITHSPTAAYDAAKAHRMALEEELAAARSAEDAERSKVISRAEALLAAIGETPALPAIQEHSP
jgi:putative chitinase